MKGCTVDCMSSSNTSFSIFLHEWQIILLQKLSNDFCRKFDGLLHLFETFFDQTNIWKNRTKKLIFRNPLCSMVPHFTDEPGQFFRPLSVNHQSWLYHTDKSTSPFTIFALTLHLSGKKTTHRVIEIHKQSIYMCTFALGECIYKNVHLVRYPI